MGSGQYWDQASTGSDQFWDWTSFGFGPVLGLGQFWVWASFGWTSFGSSQFLVGPVITSQFWAGQLCLSQFWGVIVFSECSGAEPKALIV